jgi:nucleoside-diphosphate-sugar epimerase
MINNQFRLQNSIKYPTSIIVNGATPLGLTVAASLLEQGGYVVIVDNYDETNIAKLKARFGEEKLLALIDYSSITHLPDELRRLDYVFYLQHEASNFEETISTHKFLKYSNYLDAMLSLTSRFEAKFLLTTSIKAHQLLLDSMQMDLNFGERKG